MLPNQSKVFRKIQRQIKKLTGDEASFNIIETDGHYCLVSLNFSIPASVDAKPSFVDDKTKEVQL